MGSGASSAISAVAEKATDEELAVFIGESFSEAQQQRIVSVIQELDSQPKRRESPDEEMRRVLGCGHVRLVKSIWLVETPDGWIVKRHQDLPEEAFVRNQDACEPFEEGADPDEAVFKTLVVSYPWLTKRHPDPHGFHCKRLKRFFQIWEIFMQGVFMDFMSLPQVDANGVRTAAEDVIFKKGLSIINLLYGSDKTFVVQLTKMPEVSFEGMNAIPYGNRGWCCFEQTVAGIVKPKVYLMNLGIVDVDLFDEQKAITLEGIASKCCSGMLPPLSPSSMHQLLQRSQFTNGADVEKVSSMYKSFFEDVSGAAEFLNFAPYRAMSTWTQEEATRLSEALPLFTACKTLCLSGSDAFRDCGPSHLEICFSELQGHRFGDDSIEILAPSFAKMPALETLTLALCTFGEKGLSDLEAVLAAKASLTKLSLPLALHDTLAGKSFVRAWTAADKDPADLAFEAGKADSEAGSQEE